MARPLDTADDAALLAAARSDADAFAIFYRRHERLVVGWLMRRTHHAELTADLAAEVFAAAYLASGRFRPGGAPAAAWLLGIARNVLRDTARRRRIEDAARQRLGLERVEHDDAELERVEALDGNLVGWLDELPVEQREAVRAYVLEDEDYRDLAARLAISQEVVRKRVSRGLAGLRHRLNAAGEGP